jgi:wyosine [tRNA(Phe)-imidazoG37] synthetase (radical SAM superfamily)
VGERFRHVYGPVASRRLGLSLGIDLLPGKLCSYDCPYCQVGPTRELTLERREFFPPEQVLREVEAALARGPAPDLLTVAGSGEPTLYASLGELLLGLHRLSDLPVALITNGSLLYDEQVLEQVLGADLLVPSLDAGDPEVFQLINGPHPALSFDRMVDGLVRAAELHPGTVRMEVMLCAGLNDSDESLRKLARLLAGMKLDMVEINSPVRPVAARQVTPCSQERLERACRLFGERARIIGGYGGAPAVRRMRELPPQVLLGLLARRPCTAEELSSALGLPEETITAALAAAVARGEIREERRGGLVYYLPA